MFIDYRYIRDKFPSGQSCTPKKVQTKTKAVKVSRAMSWFNYKQRPRCDLKLGGALGPRRATVTLANSHCDSLVFLRLDDGSAALPPVRRARGLAQSDRHRRGGPRTPSEGKAPKMQNHLSEVKKEARERGKLEREKKRVELECRKGMR